MAKQTVPTDEKFDNVDFDLFKALEALDRKDYGYYDRLTEDQKKKFSPYMLIQWMATVIKTSSDIQDYYVRSVDYFANVHLLNENVSQHPKLAWLMLCSASPDKGKQFHKWIPQIKERVYKLKDQAKSKDIKEYFTKLYPNASSSDIKELTQAYVEDQHKQFYIGTQFPDMKYDEIRLLSELISDEDIENYEKSLGNG